MNSVHPTIAASMAWFAPKPKMTHQQAVEVLLEIENQFGGSSDEIDEFLHSQAFNMRSDVEVMLSKRQSIELEPQDEEPDMPATIGRDDRPSWGKA